MGLGYLAGVGASLLGECEKVPMESRAPVLTLFALAALAKSSIFNLCMPVFLGETAALVPLCLTAGFFLGTAGEFEPLSPFELTRTPPPPVTPPLPSPRPGSSDLPTVFSTAGLNFLTLSPG